MNFDFSDEQKQLRDEARRFLSENCTPKEVRAVLEGKAKYDAKIWKGLADLGLLGIAIPEEFGGAGAGRLELCVVAEELGRALAPVPYSSTVYLASELLMLAGSDAQKKHWLPKIAAGEAIGTLALVEAVGDATPKSIQATVSGGKLTGRKTLVPEGEIADFAIVVAREKAGDDARGVGLYIVDMKGAGVSAKSVETVDPSRNHAEVAFSGAPADPLGQVGEGWSCVDKVLDRAAVLVAFEQIGGADRALEMGRDYALDRMAFGRPIGSFQAVKHMLADMYVAATLARSNAYYGAWALSTDAGELAEAAANARVSATQAYQLCAKNNTQVHGGMGFTWEFDCHLYYRRSNLLALSLGSLTMWENRLIDEMRKRNAAA
ncbi:MAG: acyl-CoA/acyl-ACP dehydrogenase [Hyphomicrobiales bacterium]|nr:acyl-CoA/acyl-ACP dehydrogenase [Hyphomicrobiales bacterium]